MKEFEFQYNLNKGEEESVLKLYGRLDTLSAAEFEKGLEPLLENPGKRLLIDNSELTYISSSGLRCFVKLHNACKKAGTEMVIEGTGPAIREIFDLTGFSKIFNI